MLRIITFVLYIYIHFSVRMSHAMTCFVSHREPFLLILLCATSHLSFSLLSASASASALAIVGNSRQPVPRHSGQQSSASALGIVDSSRQPVR